MTQGMETNDGLPEPHSKTEKSTGRVVAIGLGVVVLLFVLFVFILLPGVRQKKHAEAREQARNNCRELVSAAQRLHKDYQRLPFNQVSGNGTALLSWRVQLLPYLGQQNLFDLIDRSLPWDAQGSAFKSEQLKTVIPVFQSSRAAESPASSTHFVAVIDPASPMSGEKVTFDSIDNRDGKNNTALFLEFPDSNINWAEPRDVTLAEAIDIIKNSDKSFGTVVAMADGNSIVVPNSASAEDITKLFLLDNGKPQGTWWNEK